ncbi:hypothetical protein AB1K83_17370 [Sporosarcina sp. 179-K 3D1 HS]|uniref:hypothetical protein n=1 Tax=Sporosarcina sp. 179-K 3D1 HS TaxID=3232169 RepID=UPI00399EF820
MKNGKVFLLISLLLLGACSKNEVFEHIEVFSIETMDESEDPVIPYTLSGHKNTNSITYTREWRDKVKFEVSAIEDYYDTDGNYIKTVVFHSSGEHKKLHNQISGDKEEEELNEPSTILLSPEYKQTSLELTEEEKERVKRHVESYVDRLK